jgi:hypothetical protein
VSFVAIRQGLKGDGMRWLLIGTLLALMVMLAVDQTGAAGLGTAVDGATAPPPSGRASILSSRALFGH